VARGADRDGQRTADRQPALSASSACDLWLVGSRGYAALAARSVGAMNAPMIHRSGKKNPIQNSQ
jgi:hypothetical protein